jgi:hypothetical protein
MAQDEEQGGISDMIQRQFQNMDTNQVKQKFQEAGDRMDQGERKNLIQTIMSQLQTRGFDTQNVASQAGLRSTNADEMDSGDLGKLGGFVKDKAPFIIPLVMEKMPQIAKHFGFDVSGIMGGLFGREK